MIDETTIISNGDFLIDRSRERFIVTDADALNNKYFITPVSKVNGSDFTPEGYTIERLIRERFRIDE